MRDCVILINDRLVSLSHTTHSSSLNYLSMMSLREVLYVCLLTIIDTMSVRESGSRLTSESCPDSENTCSTLGSVVRWDTVWFKKKCKGNRTRRCHIISNSFSVGDFVQTHRPYQSRSEWYTKDEVIGYKRDEVIGYKSIVIEDNSLPRGHVWEVGVSDSRGDFTWHVYVHTNRWGENNWSTCGLCVLICLSTHISGGFWRRGNPMEVIVWSSFQTSRDFDHPTQVSWTIKKKTDGLEKTKKLKFYLSLMSTTLLDMSWVEH